MKEVKNQKPAAPSTVLSPAEARVLLTALTAFKQGDSSVRLPVEWSGMQGKLAETFNEVVELNERMAEELSRLRQIVGKEGKLKQRAEMGDVHGFWRDQIHCVNALIDDLVHPTSETARVIGAVAQGDLSQTMALEVDDRPLEGEFLRTAKTINKMVDQLGSFASEVTRVAREVGAEGKLGGQAKVKGLAGTWKDRCRLLLVEPDPACLATLREYLTGLESVELICASDGPRAAELLREGRLDCAIVNPDTPELRLAEVIGEMRDGNVAPPPVIAYGRRAAASVGAASVAALERIPGVHEVHSVERLLDEVVLALHLDVSRVKDEHRKVLDDIYGSTKALSGRRVLIVDDDIRNIFALSSVLEQAARSVAEESHRRASFLAEATQVMASSLDVDTILQGAAGLVVPFMADYGAIVLVNEDGSVRAQRGSCVAGWEQYLGAHRALFEAVLARCQAAVIEKGAHEMCDRLTPPPADGDAADDAPLGEIHAFPLVTRGKARGALLLALGPSERRLAGADLSLADSLAGRAAGALDNCLLYEEIQRTDRRKNEFLATLSHELRNPLAPMRAALHMLRSQSVEPERSRSLLETMDRQVAQMTRLVEDLLDISRITRGAIELRRETLDVSAEVRNAIESCQGQLEIGRHELVVNLPAEPLQVAADRVRLQQILENVILNAAKYTEPGGRIEVSAQGDASQVLIRVRDNGIGIAPDKLAQVWDLFVQVDESPDRIRKGLGIGLALVKDLVRRHGGTVEASSEGLGMGSTFTIRLPRAARQDVQSAAPAQSPGNSQAAASKRVLIVDDNVDAAETLAMMLELLGQQTRQAHEGNGALKAAVEFKPELVFMDIGLPGLSGHEIASRMRRDLGMTDTYIVALSGYGTEEDRRKSLYAGFDSHLVKPLDPSTLPSILAAADRRRDVPANAMMDP